MRKTQSTAEREIVENSPHGFETARVGRRHQLVTDYQEALYSYVHRMLPNSEDAADVTQGIFATILANFEQYDPRRELKPWIYRVATNAVYRHFRDTRLRRKKEKCAAMTRSWVEQGEDLEKKEAEEIVQEQLATLPEDARSLLILHYYNGLTQREIAAVLQVPRTTVRDHLNNSRGLLRKRLQANGYIALVPGAESLMQNSGGIEVPAHVSGSLFRLVGSGSISGAKSAGILLGGTLMSKQIGGVALALVIFAFATGVAVDRFAFTGNLRRSAKPAGEEHRKEQLQVATQALSALQREYAALEKRWEHAQEHIKSLEGNLEEQQRADGEVAAMVEAENSPSVGIDWLSLAAVVAKSREAVHRLAELRANRMDTNELDPVHQAALREFMLEWNRAAAQARVKTPYPVLDAEILPRCVSTLLGGLVGLTEGQASSLSEDCVAMLRDYTVDSETTPLLAFEYRTALFEQITARVGEVLDPNQLESWNKIQPVWEHLAEGNRRRVEIGLDRDDTEERLLEVWQQHYAFVDEQSGLVSSASRDFLAESRRVLEKYGRTSEDAPALNEEQRAKMNEEFHRLQRQADEELFTSLTEEQRERLLRQFPVIIRFNSTTSFDRDTDRNRGF